MRLLEEVLELAQAENISGPEADTILNQVYSKPKGNPHQELGGVLITMAAYAGVCNYDLDTCFMLEFERIMDPVIINRVRERNLNGDKIGIKKKPDFIIHKSSCRGSEYGPCDCPTEPVIIKDA